MLFFCMSAIPCELHNVIAKPTVAKSRVSFSSRSRSQLRRFINPARSVESPRRCRFLRRLCAGCFPSTPISKANRARCGFARGLPANWPARRPWPLRFGPALSAGMFIVSAIVIAPPRYLSAEGEIFTGDQALALAKRGRGANACSRNIEPACDVWRLNLSYCVTCSREIASDLAAARAQGVYQALAKALRGSPQELLDTVEHSEQRGRGGAGFLTGAKWRSCARAPGEPKYVVVNGDEGDPGSFIDRVLMEDDPHSVLEGLILCAYAVGASQGIIFIRSEYPRAIACMRQALAAAYEQGILGASVLGSKFALEVSVCPGSGSYVCGEETAMLNAIEGWRGEVRIRPPYPAVEGLYGKPTVVNNVETLVSIPFIVERGPEVYAAFGTARSKGTKVFSLNHGFARPGLVEVEFGITLLEVVAEAGKGAGGQRLDAAILGGPMGSVLLPHEWGVPVCYVHMADKGIQLGHGGLVAIPEGTDFRALLEHWLEFMMDESCGKCVPCRLGSKRAWRVLHEQEGDSLPGAPAPVV